MSDVEKFKLTMKKLVSQLRTWAKADQNVNQMKALDSYETKIGISMSVDCRGTIGLFINAVYPYAHHIMQDNDQYFIQSDLSINYRTSGLTDEDMEYNKLQQQLKEWWPAFSEEKKEFVRKHVKLLVMLGTLVVRNEKMRQIINEYRDPLNPLLFK